jgi:hypothetical protein
LYAWERERASYYPGEPAAPSAHPCRSSSSGVARTGAGGFQDARSAPGRHNMCPGAGQALYGLLAALAGLCLPDPQVAQQPVERLLGSVFRIS